MENSGNTKKIIIKFLIEEYRLHGLLLQQQLLQFYYHMANTTSLTKEKIILHVYF